IPFSLFFFLGGLVWRTLSCKRRLTALAGALAVGALLAILIFSYFYLWTTAAAWLACLALLLVVARPVGWMRNMLAFGVIFVIGLAALVPYTRLLFSRAES